MAQQTSVITLRVRYGETDQMGTFANAAALEWFECGRTEWLRSAGLPYAEMERRGAFLPVIEAHVVYRGRARYDDLLRVTTAAAMADRVRLRCDVTIVRDADGAPVAEGYTLHAFTDAAGKAIRPPEWALRVLGAPPGR